MAARGQGLFSLYIYIENFKNLLVRNHWTDFHIILQKCSIGDPLPRLFEPIGFIEKHGHQGAGLIFTIYLYRKLKKSPCQKPQDQFPYNFAKNVPLVILYQDCSSHLDSSKNMATRGWGLFSLYIYIENLKNLLVRNHWTNCDIILQKYSFGDLLPGLIFRIYLYRKLWNSSCQIPPDRFQCCFGDPLPRMFKQSWFVKKHGC